MAKYSEEDLAELTAEEREALTAEQDEDEDTGADDDAASMDDGDDDAPAGDDDQPAGDDQPPAEQPPANDEPPANDKSDVPLLMIEDTDQDQDRLTDIKTAKATLTQQFDDGEITAGEFHTKLDELNTLREEIVLRQQKNRIAAEMKQQQAIATWQAELNGFLSAHPEYERDQNGQPKSMRARMLDTLVREMAPEWEGTGTDLLNSAHERLVAEIGTIPNGKQQAPAKDTGKAKPEIPPTLAKIPAAEPNTTENAKFARLDQLMNKGDPEAYERALNQLSPSDYDEYMRTR